MKGKPWGEERGAEEGGKGGAVQEGEEERAERGSGN